MKHGAELVLSNEEREELTFMAEGWAVFTAKCARDILLCVDEGIMPPPESIEWFIDRFRTVSSK